MGNKTAIAWTDATWNPVSGCSKVSPGCAHCFAETLSLRFGYSKLPWTPANAVENVVLHPERLMLPLKWKRPRRIFVNSMSDLFHENVPDAFLDKVFAIMALTPHHILQVLTKRPERMQQYIGAQKRPVVWHDGTIAPQSASTASHVLWAAQAIQDRGVGGLPYLTGDMLDWPLPNVWLGVSVENQRWADARIPLLLETPAVVRFISAEPLLGPLDLLPFLPSTKPQVPSTGLDWVIIGGESGQHMTKPQYRHRWMKTEWAQDIVDKCHAAGVPVFFKQASGTRPGMHEDLLGEIIQEMPDGR